MFWTQRELDRMQRMLRQLKTQFAHQFRNPISIVVAPGWLGLLVQMMAQVDQVLKRCEKALWWTSIETKYGSLRADFDAVDYDQPWTREVEGILRRYEDLSETVCERCGKPGKPHQTPGGWIVVVCKKHQDPLGQVRDEHRRMCAVVVKRFPYQFDKSFFDSSPAIGIGWMPIFERLCSVVDGELSTEAKKAFKWHQVKQKLGTLRAYFWVGPDDQEWRSASERAVFLRLRAHVEQAQKEAAETCEICGASPAALDDTGLYLRTLCSLCIAVRRNDCDA